MQFIANTFTQKLAACIIRTSIVRDSFYDEDGYKVVVHPYEGEWGNLSLPLSSGEVDQMVKSNREWKYKVRIGGGREKMFSTILKTRREAEKLATRLTDCFLTEAARVVAEEKTEPCRGKWIDEHSLRPEIREELIELKDKLRRRNKQIRDLRKSLTAKK